MNGSAIIADFIICFVLQLAKFLIAVVLIFATLMVMPTAALLRAAPEAVQCPGLHDIILDRSAGRKRE